MDKITKTLNIHAKRPYHSSIIAAMKLAQKKMDRYYSLTDSSAAYRIAMVLHPGMKFEYFRQHEWEEEWIEQAKSLVYEEYIAVYKKDLPDQPENKADVKVSRSHTSGLGLTLL
jgi:hypothetical protein